MKVKIQIVVESDNGDSQVVQEIMQIERGALQPENLGLKLAEAKTLLQNLQHTLAEQQVAEYSQQQELCLHCSQKLLHKDKRTIVYRTLFGKLHLQCPRLFHCPCQEQPTRSFNPVANLLPERTSKELLYLESKYGSLMSYGLSVKLLQEVLPIEGEINTTAIRNNLHSIGQRLEDELGEEKGGYIEGCPRDWEELPRPDLPLVLGMDGGDYPASPYIFQSSRLGPLAHDTIAGIVERAGELAGLPFPIHAHMLRHGTGYYLANRGIDTRTIQSYLGHKNIQHTVRYTELASTKFQGLWND